MRVLRGLSGQLLPCGCLVGTYETYGGAIVTVVDDSACTCGNPLHKRGAVIEGPEVPRPSSHPVRDTIG